MKKFYKTAVICCLVGIILMGVGGAVTIYSILSFEYMGSKYNSEEKSLVNSNEISLPDNINKIVYYDYNDNITVEKDENVAKNKAVVETYARHDVVADLYFQPNMYLFNSYTVNYSKYPVNYMEMTFNSDSKSDLQIVSDILNDIKNKQWYDYNLNYSDFEVVIKVSPEDYDRFAKLDENKYTVYDEEEYLNMDHDTLYAYDSSEEE